MDGKKVGKYAFACIRDDKLIKTLILFSQSMSMKRQKRLDLFYIMTIYRIDTLLQKKIADFLNAF